MQLLESLGLAFSDATPYRATIVEIWDNQGIVHVKVSRGTRALARFRIARPSMSVSLSVCLSVCLYV